jgi:hypothetical protein
MPSWLYYAVPVAGDESRCTILSWAFKMSDELATKADLTDVKTELLERMEKVETTLLKEFHKWAQITETRIRVNETLAFGLNERMASLESRVRDLEQKRN